MQKAARALRMYEYMTPEGIVYWSFSRLPGTTVQRLVLVDHTGTYFRRHIADIHRMALEDAENDVESE